MMSNPATPPARPREHRVFAYGTLPHPASRARTLGRAAAVAVVPAEIDGFRRRFASVYPWWGKLPSLRRSWSGRERAAALAEPAPGARLNGLVFAVDERQLARLDRRERLAGKGRYTRIRVTARAFGEDRSLGEVWLYATTSAPDPRARILPHWVDLADARRACHAVSPAFGQAYDATTLLADGRARVAEDYASAPRTRRAFARLPHEPRMRWSDWRERHVAWAIVLLLWGYLLAAP